MVPSSALELVLGHLVPSNGLPEFIEIFVPTKDRAGRPLAAARLRAWKQRWFRYLLDELKVTGLQESKREGVWKQALRETRECDPEADRLTLVRERVYVMRTSCTRAQLAVFRRSGEEQLLQMGKALDQEAVAYETRAGLVVLFIA